MQFDRNENEYAASDRVRLLRSFEIEAVMYGLRTCKDSVDRMDTVGDTLGPRDKKLLLDSLLSDPPHTSVVEHAVYQFEVRLSRGNLQEFRRTRMSSPSVQSSRFTLGKQLRGEADLSKCLHATGDADVDELIMGHMQAVAALAARRREAGNPIPNDRLKYALVDAWMTVEVVTINASSLRNLFRTRMGKGVLLEYRELAWAMFDALPKSHIAMYADIVRHVVERDGYESLTPYARKVLDVSPGVLSVPLMGGDA